MTENENAIATLSPAANISSLSMNMEPKTLGDLLELSRLLVASRLFPSIDSPEKMATLIMQGRALGLTFAQATKGGYVTPNNKVGFETNILLGVIRRDPECVYIEAASSSRDSVTWRAKRRGREEFKMTYTWEDAQEDGYPYYFDKASNQQMLKGPWRGSGREVMLNYRCASRIARQVFGDLLYGFATAEELRDEPEQLTPREVVVEEGAELADKLRKSLGKAPPHPDAPTESSERPAPPVSSSKPSPAGAAPPAEVADVAPEQTPSAKEDKPKLTEPQEKALAELVSIQKFCLFVLGEEDGKKAWRKWLAKISDMNGPQYIASLGKARSLKKKIEYLQIIFDLQETCAKEGRKQDVNISMAPWEDTSEQLQAAIAALQARLKEPAPQ